MASSNFPLMGFPNENNDMHGEVVYQCFFEKVRVVIWYNAKLFAGNYGLNLYTHNYTDQSLTHVADRYEPHQKPIHVADAFEAQLAINYLLQTYLPTEVTNDFSNAGEEGYSASRSGASDREASGLRADPAGREAVE